MVDTPRARYFGEVRQRQVDLGVSVQAAPDPAREYAPVVAIVGSGGGALDAAGTAVQSNVAQSAVSVTIRAALASRLGLIVVNDADADLYLSFSGAASVSNYALRLAPGDTWTNGGPTFTGAVTGIWGAAGAGFARVTELTA